MPQSYDQEKASKSKAFKDYIVQFNKERYNQELVDYVFFKSDESSRDTFLLKNTESQQFIIIKLIISDKPASKEDADKFLTGTEIISKYEKMISSNTISLKKAA
jgi:hypothetical protein